MNLPGKSDLSEKKYGVLLNKIKKCYIDLSDIDEKFIRGTGKGGQKINKTNSCVYLKHKPTGISIKYQKERKRSMNRVLALRELVDAIERKMSGKASKKEREIERKRKSKHNKRRKTKIKYG